MLRRPPLRWFRAFRLAFAISAAGCTAAPIEGAALDRLKADLAGARPGFAAIAEVGPRTLAAGGPEAAVVMPFVSHGTKVAEFSLYDGYFKVAFTAADELRALGLRAGLAPRVWSARSEAVAFQTRSLDDDAVELNLTRVAAKDEVLQLFRLKPAERRDLLVSRLTLIAAQSGLPPALRARARVTGREIRDLYFAADEEVARAPLRLDVEALELIARAEEGSFGGERTARARLRLALASGGRAILDREVACEADAGGTGVRFEKLGSTYSFTMGPDDPLEHAVRGCVRAFLAEAAPLLGRAR